MQKDSSEYQDLLKLAGGNEELANSLFERINQTQREITERGMITRADPAPEKPTEAAPVQAPNTDAILAEIKRANDDTAAKLAAIVNRLEKLERTDAEKIRQHIDDMPPAQPLGVDRPKVNHQMNEAPVSDIEKARAKQQEILAQIKH